MSVTVSDLVVSVAAPTDAAGMVEVIHAAFGARPPLDPPATAIAETAQSVGSAIAAAGGIYATVADRPAGALLFHPVDEHRVAYTRVSVHPEFQRHGIASAMVTAAGDYAAELGFCEVELFARAEFAELIAFWQHRGFRELRPAPHGVILARPLPVALDVHTAEDMRALGARLAGVLQAGDLIIATGDLGAGKTTLAQGIGAGLGCEGPVISPTFVLSRLHRSRTGGPLLLHVDAYRLGSAAELDDLDLDAYLADAVTVVEWGAGIAETLADARLEVDIRRSTYPTGAPEYADHRMVIVRSHGARWAGVDLGDLRVGATRGSSGG